MIHGIRLPLFLTLFGAFAAGAPLRAADLLYVMLGTQNRVSSYDVSLGTSAAIAASVTTLASTNITGANGLAFDSSGNLYASNVGDGTISKFNSAGNFVFKWSTGSGPYLMAFQVPEPSTWVMALAGIACVGWGAFRRHKRA